LKVRKFIAELPINVMRVGVFVHPVETLEASLILGEFVLKVDGKVTHFGHTIIGAFLDFSIKTGGLRGWLAKPYSG
jgi:uncharacterized membrane protein YvlD (DUF360 family)